MTRDSTATYLHTHSSHHADLLESFTHPSTTHIAPEDIFVPQHLQPLNPEDEDDVVPDQHAAFGIQRATQNKREVQWRDFGLEELSRRGHVGGSAGGGVGARGAMGASGHGSMGQEPVLLALRRRVGGGGGGAGRGEGAGAGVGVHANGLPR